MDRLAELRDELEGRIELLESRVSNLERAVFPPSPPAQKDPFTILQVDGVNREDPEWKHVHGGHVQNMEYRSIRTLMGIPEEFLLYRVPSELVVVLLRDLSLLAIASCQFGESGECLSYYGGKVRGVGTHWVSLSQDGDTSTFLLEDETYYYVADPVFAGNEDGGKDCSLLRVKKGRVGLNLILRSIVEEFPCDAVVTVLRVNVPVQFEV